MLNIKTRLNGSKFDLVIFCLKCKVVIGKICERVEDDGKDGCITARQLFINNINLTFLFFFLPNFILD
jgi:hypothetical protein